METTKFETSWNEGDLKRNAWTAGVGATAAIASLTKSPIDELHLAVPSETAGTTAAVPPHDAVECGVSVPKSITTDDNTRVLVPNHSDERTTLVADFNTVHTEKATGTVVSSNKMSYRKPLGWTVGWTCDKKTGIVTNEEKVEMYRFDPKDLKKWKTDKYGFNRRGHHGTEGATMFKMSIPEGATYPITLPFVIGTATSIESNLIGNELFLKETRKGEKTWSFLRLELPGNLDKFDFEFDTNSSSISRSEKAFREDWNSVSVLRGSAAQTSRAGNAISSGQRQTIPHDPRITERIGVDESKLARDRLYLNGDAYRAINIPRKWGAPTDAKVEGHTVFANGNYVITESDGWEMYGYPDVGYVLIHQWDSESHATEKESHEDTLKGQ